MEKVLDYIRTAEAGFSLRLPPLDEQDDTNLRTLTSAAPLSVTQLHRLSVVFLGFYFRLMMFSMLSLLSVRRLSPILNQKNNKTKQQKGMLALKTRLSLFVDCQDFTTQVSNTFSKHSQQLSKLSSCASLEQIEKSPDFEALLFDLFDNDALPFVSIQYNILSFISACLKVALLMFSALGEYN